MKTKSFHHPFTSFRLGFVSAGLGILALASPLLLAQLQTAHPLTGPDPAVGGPAALTSARANEAYGKLSLSFEANQGQTDQSVNFLARGAGYTLFLTPTETVFVLARKTDAQVTSQALPGQDTTPAPNATPSAPPAVLHMKIVGVNAGAEVAGVDKLPGIVNYLIGNEPQKWHANIPTFSRVQYRDVYPGVDLVYYGNQRQLEYDFVVAPGRDANAIALEFQGADKITVDADGGLLLSVGRASSGSHGLRLIRRSMV